MKREKSLTQSKKRRDAAKRNLKSRILAEARRVLREKSADEISLRSIARACGVSEAAPYRHFRDRQDLLACLAIEGFRLLRERLLVAAEAKLSPRAKFLAAAAAYLSMGEKHPEQLRLIFGAGLPAASDYPELREAGQAAFLTLVSVVAECQKADLIAKGDPISKAMHTWMAIHGFTLLYISRRCEWLGLTENTVEKAMGGFVEELLSGLGARQNQAFQPVICERQTAILEDASASRLGRE